MTKTMHPLTCLAGILLVPALCLGQGYTITTVAGGGNIILQLGDGGPAVGAYLNAPAGVAVDATGDLYIADTGDNLVRVVNASGNITTYAGNQTLGGGFSGDGGLATNAQLFQPYAIVFGPTGNLYVADSLNNRIRMVTAQSGLVSTIAGGGNLGTTVGDGGQATLATLLDPWGVAVDSTGKVYIADTLHSRVRKVALDGTITTVAGTGIPISLGGGGIGDGGLATDGILQDPAGVVVAANGDLYIADLTENRVRKVSNGIITTVAGTGSGTFSGDGGPAINAALYKPLGLALDASGNLYIADSGNNRIRLVTSDGNIQTIAGNGVPTFGGDEGPATAASLNAPSAVAVGKNGAIYIADSQNFRVRMLSAPTPPPGTPTISTGGVVTASAFGEFTSIAPGSWIEIYGTNLATDSRTWEGSDFNGINAPTSLDGTSVTIGGQPAFVSFISSGQVNVQVPIGIATGAQQMTVTTPNGTSSSYTVNVNAAEPGLLAPASFIVGGKQYVAALFPDYANFAIPPASIAGVNSRRAQPGDTLIIYGVGFGDVTPAAPAGQLVQQLNSLTAPFHMFFGKTEASVSYDGLTPGYVGLYQFNVVVPNIPSSDQVPLTFTLGGTSGTQTLYVAVQNGALAPEIQSLTLSVAQVASGATVQGTLVLAAAAPAGGVVITLASDSTAATVPSTVTVPSGSTSATFTVTAGSVTSKQAATITATYGGASTEVTLTVAPPAKPAFTSMEAVVTFEPSGYPSGQVAMTVTSDAGGVTYTASLTNGGTFTKGAFSNQGQTLTFNTVQASAGGTPVLFILNASTELTVSGGSMTLNFPGPIEFGSVTGTMTITGKPFPGGGADITLSGAITGYYQVTLQ